jgi:hypothetical protein
MRIDFNLVRRNSRADRTDKHMIRRCTSNQDCDRSYDNRGIKLDSHRDCSFTIKIFSGVCFWSRNSRREPNWKSVGVATHVRWRPVRSTITLSSNGYAAIEHIFPFCCQTVCQGMHLKQRRNRATSANQPKVGFLDDEVPEVMRKSPRRLNNVARLIVDWHT